MSLLKPFSNLLKRAKASLQSLLPQKDPVATRLDSELAKNAQAQRQAATLTPNQADATLLRMEYATIGALDPLQFVRDGMMILNSPQKAANARTVAALTTKALQDEPNNRALQRLLDESHLQLDRNICNRIAGLHTLSRTDKAKALSENLRDAHTLIQTGAPKATREDAYTDIARTVDLLMKTDPAAGKQEVAYLSKQPYFKNVMNKAKDLFKDRPIESARYTPRAEADLAPEAQPKAPIVSAPTMSTTQPVITIQLATPPQQPTSATQPKAPLANPISNEVSEPASTMMMPFFVELHDNHAKNKPSDKFEIPDTLPQLQENGQLPGMHAAEVSKDEFDKLMARIWNETAAPHLKMVSTPAPPAKQTMAEPPPPTQQTEVASNPAPVAVEAVRAQFKVTQMPSPAQMAAIGLPVLSEVVPEPRAENPPSKAEGSTKPQTPPIKFVLDLQ